MAEAPVAHAVLTHEEYPDALCKMESQPEGMLTISMGTVNGEHLSGPRCNMR